MRGFVLCDFSFVRQRETYVIKAFEQAVACEFVDLKMGGETRNI
jgi:hypothetical protein